jgi:hypothetical protein
MFVFKEKKNLESASYCNNRIEDYRMPCNYFRLLASSRLHLYSLLPSPVVVHKQNPSTPFISCTGPLPFIPKEGTLATSACTSNYCFGAGSAPFPFSSTARLPQIIITGTGTSCWYESHTADCYSYIYPFAHLFHHSAPPSLPPSFGNPFATRKYYYALEYLVET